MVLNNNSPEDLSEIFSLSIFKENLPFHLFSVQSLKNIVFIC